MLQYKRNQGFTLIELMIVLALLAIVLALSAPSMMRLVRGAQVQAEIQRLQLALNLARSEAVSRNSRVVLCPSRYLSSGELSCSGDFSNGWLVFSDGSNPEQFEAQEDELIRAFEALPDGYRITNRSGLNPVVSQLTYYPDGATRGNFTLMVCPPGGVVMPSLSLVINRVGRPRVARDWGECR